MMLKSLGSADHPTHITFSKFKYKFQNLITEVRELREKEQYARREMEFLIQKQKKHEVEQQQKFSAFHAEIAAADEVRSKLESNVKDLQNEISTMTNKQKELKGVIDNLLVSRDKMTNDLKASNYEQKRDIETKDSQLAVLKEKLSRNSVLFEAVEREAVRLKLVVEETRQLLNNREEEVLALKQKLAKIMGYEKLFIEKLCLLENKVKDNQIELLRKETIVADLKERLENMTKDHKLELQVKALQRIIEVKEETIQNLSGEKQALLSEIQCLELVFTKYQESAADQEMQIEKKHRGLLKSQEAECSLQEKITIVGLPIMQINFV
eukprot:Gb_24039 [translate_table: standard]